MFWPSKCPISFRGLEFGLEMGLFLSRESSVILTSFPLITSTVTSLLLQSLVKYTVHSGCMSAAVVVVQQLTHFAYTRVIHIYVLPSATVLLLTFFTLCLHFRPTAGCTNVIAFTHAVRRLCGHRPKCCGAFYRNLKK